MVDRLLVRSRGKNSAWPDGDILEVHEPGTEVPSHYPGTFHVSVVDVEDAHVPYLTASTSRSGSRLSLSLSRLGTGQSRVAHEGASSEVFLANRRYRVDEVTQRVINKEFE